MEIPSRSKGVASGSETHAADSRFGENRRLQQKNVMDVNCLSVDLALSDVLATDWQSVGNRQIPVGCSQTKNFAVNAMDMNIVGVTETSGAFNNSIASKRRVDQVSCK